MKAPGTHRWIRSLIQSWFSPPRQPMRRAKSLYRLQIERLEDRVVPSSWVVTNTSNSAGTSGSLPWAVAQADTDTSNASITFSPTAFPNATTITLASTLTLSNTAHSITINGGGAGPITVSGNNSVQVVQVNTNVTGTIENLTISDGNGGANNGGGVSIVGGTITIDHCTVTNNLAASGGGIEVTGTSKALIEDSTITGNTATGWGGGIDINGDAAFMTVIGCTISNNSLANNGQRGGGINFGGGSGNISAGFSSVIDCTICNNSANNSYWGGGGFGSAGGNFLVEGCTITGNSAVNTTNGYGGAGGGVRCDYYYAMTLENDIVWNNTANAAPDLGDGGYDTPIVNYTLVGNPSGAIIPPGSVGDIVGVATPILGSLSNNGGSTQTMAPLAGSYPVGSGGSVTVANAAISSTTTSTIGVAKGSMFAASSLAPQLSFVTQPSTTTAGAPMSHVTVQVTKPVEFDEYFKIDNEIMEVVGLTINSDGTATLNVERGVNGTTAATHAVNAPIYLISDQRGEVIPSAAVPTSVDMGAVQSAATVPIVGLGLALTMGISSGTLNGTTTALTDSTGLAVFGNLSAPATGTYQLKLAGGLVTSSSFTVSAGTFPIVSSVSPASGIAGTSVTITGTNFTGATGVTFGGVAASFTINSNTSITAAVPDGAGVVDVTVTTSVGTSEVAAADKFSYVPVVTGVSPNSGNAGGGTSVTITGSNFNGVTAVMFGANSAAAFTVNSSASITAIAPAGAGVVDVTVVNAGGVSAALGADHFAYSTGIATWIVTNTLAAGPGSLFAAVQNANADTTTPSVVTFDATVFASPQTIVLGATLVFGNSAQPINIQGPNNVAVTLDANQEGGAENRCCLIDAGVVTIQNLTLTDGTASGGNGGSIFILGGTATIDRCTVSNSIATSGGGIEVTGSSNALIENSTITGNTATGWGGGIDTNGDAAFMTVIGCTISNNALANNGQYGGGINVGGGSGNISNGVDSIINCTITGNSANNSYYGGGGIGTAKGNFLVEGCTITGNSAVNTTNGYGGAGGGIRCDVYYSMTLLNDIIWNNTANAAPDLGDGGYSTPTINYCLVGNTAGAVIPPNSAGNILGVSTNPAILGALANNGGPTQSFAPVANSFPIGSGGSVTTANAAVSSATVATVSVAKGTVFAASSLTPQLSFVTQPSNGPAGAPLSAVTVQITKPVDFDEYIKIDNEIMEVVGLTINSDGTATLNVERGVNGTTAATHAANAPIYLISDQRGEVVANPALPTSVDMGSVQSAATTPTAGVGLALTMGINTGTLNGTTSALTNSAGQAVFDNLSVPATGTYQLKLAGGLATSSSFTISTGTYPIVTGLSPASGIAGASVTISGTNLSGATGVSFGGIAATSFTVNSNTSITAAAPAGSGIVDISVTTSAGTSAVAAADRFNYASTVASVSPGSGNASGGTSVTITGVNFNGVTAVMFGGANAATYAVNSATSITATAPAGAGVVDVTVVNAGGASAVSNGDHFTYSTGTAIWTVTNTLASGPGSLFKAVQNANFTTTTPSLITFDPTVFATPQTITLAASLLFGNAVQPITVAGPTGVAVTIDGNRQGGAMIQDFVIDAGVVAIENLSIANGNAGSGNGGGLLVLAGNVTVDNCTITNNIAGNGGGINVGPGNLLLENSVITGNSTNTTSYGNGGGINASAGTLTIIGCLFTQNVSNNSTGGHGGAIDEQNSIMTVINSTFTGNTAAAGQQQYGGNGGAICSASSPDIIGTNYISGCTITGNTAQNGTGGGIALGYSYNLTMLNNLIWNNTALNAPDFGNNNNSQIINYNLIGNTSGSVIPAGSVGNILGVSTSPAILGSLANNGGPTQTMAPVSGSPEIGAAGAVTTISASVNNTTTPTITVANLTRLAASALPTFSSGSYFTIQIGSEQMAVIGASTTALTVVRGINGTTAATHPSGASVYLVSDQRSYLVPANSPPVVDMGACQSTGVNDRPTISAVSPNAGILSGGTTVIITGANFTGATAVFFGSTAAANFTVNSNTQITAVDPAEGPGTVDIAVTAPLGTSAQSTSDQFTYAAPPTVSGLNPDSGSTAGGTSVVITGANFTGAAAVKFGSTNATSFTINSDIQITATSPVGSGVVDVTVVTAGGTSASTTTDQFTYLDATTTILTDNGPNPSTVGEDVSFAVTVSSANTSELAPSGSDTDGETVFIEDASNANAIVASPTLSGGTVTFTISDLTVGTHDLFAVYNGDATNAGSNSSATPVTQVVNYSGPAPAWVSDVVNGGTPQYVDQQGMTLDIANQNSVVLQILVTFNEPVTLSPGAFSVVNNAGAVIVNSGAMPNTAEVDLNAPIQVGDGHQWIVTFADSLGTHPNGYGAYLIDDGVYTLHIDHTKVTANAQTMAADNDTGFWALYGDVTYHHISGVDLNVGTGYVGDGYSDASVGCCDFAVFKQYYNTDSSNDYAPPNYYLPLDYDLDGSIATSDFVHFKVNFNTDWVF
jgi:IPT/TIG domain